LLLAEKKEYDEAVMYLRKAAELMPDRSRIYYNLGLILQFQGKNREAESALKKASDMEPMNIDYKYALADHYIKTENYIEARKTAEYIKRNFPNIQLGDQLLDYLKNLNVK
jgi:Tfp pilus assembly protein PilF